MRVEILLKTDGGYSKDTGVCFPTAVEWIVLYYFTIETRETSQRSPICRGAHMYGSTHIRTWVHLHACVGVGLGKLYGLRGSTEVRKKKVQDRYSEMDVCD